MKAKRYWIVVVMLVACCLAGCETVHRALKLKKPTARLTGLNFGEVNLASATLLFDVEVDNPYSVALPLMNLDYGLTSGGNKFLAGGVDIQTTVPAKSKKTVSLPAKIDYLEVLRALKGIRPGSKIPYKAELGLSVDTPALGLLNLPLEKTGELTLPSVSDTNLKDIWNIIRPK
ncbi:MAG: LEA type 2 family protein [Phycisphaerae bacterium]|nr:LEA type 2 family protein [Phycisphaerae bacterium]